jgi:hypothetical protein
MGDLFQTFLNRIGQGYKEADKRLGGWLPGGGTASPVTRAVLPTQVAPTRSKELEKITGVKGRIIDPQKTPSLVSTIAPVFSAWGTNDYANPLLGEIGMSNYQGTGKSPYEVRTEIHELGHLNPVDKKYYSYGGVAGRFLTGVSERLGKPAPLELAGGLALQYLDAPEEDRAERFAARFAQQLNYPAREISPQGTSAYGDMLRKQGSEISQKAIGSVINPFGIPEKIINKTTQFVNQQLAAPLQQELSRALPGYRQRAANETVLSPETLEESRRLNNLAKQIEALGIEPKY